MFTESKVISGLIQREQTVVDVSGEADWARSVESEVRGVQVNEACAYELDSFAKRAGLRHIHFLYAGEARDVFEVLDGARRLLHHSRIDYVQFSLDLRDYSLVAEVREAFAAEQYVLFVPEEGRLAFFQERSQWAGTQPCPLVAIQERLLPLRHGSTAMFDLGELCRKHGVTPRGVIHVGANDGAEIAMYERMALQDVLFIEANPVVFERLRTRVGHLPGVCIVNRAILDKPGLVTLHVTNFDQSSSLLPLARHLEFHPTVLETGVIDVQGVTLDEQMREGGVAAERYNLLNIDIQGAELMALHGATETLAHIDAINLEINFDEVYRGCSQVEDLDGFLEKFQFRRVATTCPYHPSWGDAFYVKADWRAS